MENQKDKEKKQGVIPGSELEGSDADKAYNEQGEIPTLGEDSADSEADELSGADSDEAGK